MDAKTMVGGPVPEVPRIDLRAGTKIDGYRLECVIGRGGTGVVYRGHHDLLDRTVAVKLVGDVDPEYRQRFIDEARAAAAISHPGVVCVHDAGEVDHVLFLVMDYVDCPNLAHVLQQEGALELPRARRIATGVADALDAAHALGILHRDVKPANVLVAGDTPRLVDFGLTRRLSGDVPLLEAGRFYGTVAYVAPEQIEGGEVDIRADVYSMACMIFEMVTGSLPFPGKRDRDVLAAHLHAERPLASERSAVCPAALDAVLQRGMARRPEERFETCGALARTLGDTLGTMEE